MGVGSYSERGLWTLLFFFHRFGKVPDARYAFDEFGGSMKGSKFAPLKISHAFDEFGVVDEGIAVALVKLDHGVSLFLPGIGRVGEVPLA